LHDSHPVQGLDDLFPGTWNIRETKNISEIAMKLCILKDKVTRKFHYWDKLATKPIVAGKKRQKKFMIPGLGPEKV
jgi:hypothetical protein